MTVEIAWANKIAGANAGERLWLAGESRVVRRQPQSSARLTSHEKMRFKRGSGGAGQFILLQAVARGGQLVTTNGLPTITGAWRYSEDQYGVVVRMSRDDYEAVEKLLRQAFGEPKFGPSETKDRGKLGGYRLTPQGGAIQFGYDAEGTQVIVLRQLTKQEFADGFMRAMKGLGKSGTQ